MVPSVFGRLSSVFGGVQNHVVLALYSKTIGLEDLPSLSIRELENIADSARILVLMYFISDNMA